MFLFYFIGGDEKSITYIKVLLLFHGYRAYVKTP